MADFNNELVLRVDKNGIYQVKKKTKRKLSKLGCYDCKQRKVKCDEKKPTCGNCCRRKTKCIWNVNHDVKILDDNGSNICLHLACPFQNNNDFQNTTFSWLESRLNFQDAELYYAFRFKFVPSVSQSYVRENNSVFINIPKLIENSKLFEELYLACGAYTLGSSNEKYYKIASMKYSKSIRSIMKAIRDEPECIFDYWTTDFFQLLQILAIEHFLGSERDTDTLIIFNACFYFMCLKADYLLKSSSLSVGRQTDNQQTRLLSNTDILTIENMILNYSEIMLLCDKYLLDKMIPNPFNNSYLFKVLINQDSYTNDSWGNRDVYTYSILSYEISAKVIWIWRHFHLWNNEYVAICQYLMKCSLDLLQKIEKVENSTVHEKVFLNTILSKLVIKAAIVILKCLLEMGDDWEAEIEIELLKVIDYISEPHVRIMDIPLWTLLIFSLCSSKLKFRTFFRNKLMSLRELKHVKTVVLVLIYLEGIWNIFPNDLVLAKLKHYNNPILL